VKILIIVLCVLAVGGVLVVGTVVYVAHRVKQAVVAKAAENGVDLNSFSNTTSESTRALPKPCTLLSKDEVSRLIGQPIERTEIKNRTCEYYGPASLSAKLAQQEGSAEVARAKTPGADAKASAIALQRMMARMGAANGNAEAVSTGSNGELPLMVLGVSPSGKATMNALSLTRALIGAASKAEVGETKNGHDGTADVFVGANVTGLGDKAMWTPQSGLYVLQGDTLIQVNPGVFPDFNAKSVAVARAIIPKI
jgi:hypothetical protein